MLRRRLTRVVLGVVISLALVGGGLGAAVAGGWLLHDSARPASVSSVVERLRASGVKGAVVVYATQGGESLSAFVSARHVYPARTAMTVVGIPCGESLSWAALEGRSMRWTLCRTPRGLELRSQVEVHGFFGRVDRTAYACSGALLAAGGSAFQCRSPRGRADGQISSLGTEAVSVGGQRLPARHVRTVARVRGDGGTETMDWWLEPRSGLPLHLAFASRTSRPLKLGGPTTGSGPTSGSSR